MPIESFIAQPAPNTIKAAYRPVVIRVSATRTDADPRPPVVYCDIYFNDVFYKTIGKTQYKQLNAGDSEWEFDVQDAAQEYLKKFLAANGQADVAEAILVVTKCLCKFRSSGYDSNGFIETEDTAPVQGTGSSDPIAGTGTASNTFYIVNATLQHADNQQLAGHLNAYKNRTWGPQTFPLSHRPEYYKLCPGDSDSFGILHGGENELSCIRLRYRNIGQNTYFPATNCEVFACPLIANIDYSLVDNGDDTQTFSFTFDTIPSPGTGLTLQYRLHGTIGAWQEAAGSAASPRDITLPLGIYDFRFVVTGDCVPSISPMLEAIGNSGEACVPVAIVGDPSLPDGLDGGVYNYAITLSGTAPFTLFNVVKPAWMTITVTGNTINFGGTPDTGDIGEGIAVGFDIGNCGSDGSGSGVSDEASFDDEIAVLAADSCTPSSWDGGTPVLANATAGVPYGQDLPLLGTAPFTLSLVTKPSWMTIDIVGSQVVISGTPSGAHLGENIPVSFEVLNCGGTNELVFFQYIDVVDGLKYYFADKYACGSCGDPPVDEGVLVSVPSSHVVSSGRYYRPEGHPTGFVYVVDPDEQDPAGAVALTTEWFVNCTLACT